MVLRMETGGCSLWSSWKTSVSFFFLESRYSNMLRQDKFSSDKWPPHPLGWGPGYRGRWVHPSPQILTQGISNWENLTLYGSRGTGSDEDREDTGTLPISLSVPFTEVSYLYYKTWTKVEIIFFMDNHNTGARWYESAPGVMLLSQPSVW